MKYGILGASSNIGESLVNLLIRKKYYINLFQHQNSLHNFRKDASIYSDLDQFLKDSDLIISLIPIWLLADIMKRKKEIINFKKLIVLSSTSASTKVNSNNIWEVDLANKYLKSEHSIKILSKELKFKLCILRPTLIWGYKRDLNITYLMSFIARYGFLILPSKGLGIRYPIHVDQLAESIISVDSNNQIGLLNILGPEGIEYKEICKNIFKWYGYKPLILIIPKNLKNIIILISKHILRKPYINKESIERIDYDPYLNFGDPLNFSSNGRFSPSENDLIKASFLSFSLQKIYKKFKKLFNYFF